MFCNGRQSNRDSTVGSTGCIQEGEGHQCRQLALARLQSKDGLDLADDADRCLQKVKEHEELGDKLKRSKFKKQIECC